MSGAGLAIAAMLLATGQAEHWIGQLELGGRSTVLAVDCPTPRASECKATVAALGGGPAGALFRPGTGEANSAYQLTLGGEAIALEPTERDADRVRGKAANGAGRFELRRLTGDRTGAPAAWSGLYRASDGRAVAIGRFGEFGEGTFLFDYGGGPSGPLLPLSGAGVRLGAAFMNPLFPAAVSVSRTPSELRVGQTPYRAVPLSRRGFALSRPGATLAGELVAPARPRGVIVVVHGSGPGERSLYDPWTFWFVSRGWAVVVFDKRGSGASTGDWRTAGFDVLAGDVEAAVDWARRQPALARLPVGLWGVSQAGWIEPEVAAETPVDFVIMQAGPTLTPAALTAASVASEMAAYGFPPQEIARAGAYYDLDVEVSRGTRPWSDLDAAYRAALASGAEWLLAPPQPADAPERAYLKRIADFDSGPFWRRVKAPVLAVWGGKDHIVPAAPDRARLQALATETGRGDIEMITLADDNHLGLLAKTGVRTEYPSLNRFDPAYFMVMAAWLRRFERR